MSISFPDAATLMKMLLDALRCEDSCQDVRILNVSLVSHHTDDDPHMHMRCIVSVMPKQALVISHWVTVGCIDDFEQFIDELKALNNGYECEIDTPEGFPTHKRVIEALATSAWSGQSLKDEQVQCCVCLDDLQPGDRIVSLPCNRGHCGHEACMLRWLGQKASCPVCRCALPSQVDPCSTEDTDRIARSCGTPLRKRKRAEANA